MSVLPTTEDCLTYLYSEHATLRANAATFLWSHVILTNDALKRSYLLNHLLRRIDDPNYHVRFAVTHAIHAAFFDCDPPDDPRLQNWPRSLAGVLLRDACQNDRGLPETCYNLLGMLLRKKHVGFFASVRMAVLAI